MVSNEMKLRWNVGYKSSRIDHSATNLTHNAVYVLLDLIRPVMREKATLGFSDSVRIVSRRRSASHER